MAVHEALARLDSQAREIIVLRDLEGLDGSEVAQALGISLAAMKSRLHRARSELRQHLGDAGWTATEVM